MHCLKNNIPSHKDLSSTHILYSLKTLQLVGSSDPSQKQHWHKLHVYGVNFKIRVMCGMLNPLCKFLYPAVFFVFCFPLVKGHMDDFVLAVQRERLLKAVVLHLQCN